MLILPSPQGKVSPKVTDEVNGIYEIEFNEIL